MRGTHSEQICVECELPCSPPYPNPTKRWEEVRASCLWHHMLSYFAILAAGVSGLAHLGPWTIAPAALALLIVSQIQSETIWRLENPISLRLRDMALLRCVAHATAAATVAYSVGWFVRLL